MVTINCPRSSIRNVQILSTYEKVKSVSTIIPHQSYIISKILSSNFFFPNRNKKQNGQIKYSNTNILIYLLASNSTPTNPPSSIPLEKNRQNIYIRSCIAKGAEPFFRRSFDASKISLSRRAFRPLMMHEAGFVGMAERGTIRHKHSAIFIVGFPGERARIRAGGWNCQKSFELRYPSSWNSSRAARGSRLKPENQARYLRNEKGSCGPATPFALK